MSTILKYPAIETSYSENKVWYLLGPSLYFTQMILWFMHLIHPALQLQQLSKKALAIFNNWCKINSLCINYSKTKFMIFKKANDKDNTDANIMCDGYSIMCDGL